ncbi:GNAT family N-acetyltransferase [Fusobacterium sp. PH5-44]|uniref:GNAT family N-acetyltransferase n=1 Tax=unclassified Fusobacterium TaxID=2648384 RepID=UPI003D235D71
MKENETLLLRSGQIQDMNIAKKMWKELFHDSSEEIEYYFDNIYNFKNILLGEVEMVNKTKKVVTLLHKNPYTMIINNVAYPTHYLVGIGTNLEDQGKKYMDSLLKHVLRSSREENKSIIFLTPIDNRIYEKYGFGYMSNLEIYKIRTDKLPNIKTPNDINIIQVTLESDDEIFEQLRTIYENKSKDFFIYLERNKSYYKEFMKEFQLVNGRIYMVHEDSQPVGYISFYTEENTVVVREILAVDGKYYKYMFSLISQMKNYYEKVKILSYDKSNMNFYMNNQMDITREIKPFIMTRILNPIKIIENSNINFINTLLNRISFLIEDDILLGNSGFYTILRDRTVKFYNHSSDKKNEIYIKIKIENLSSMLFGYFSPKEMLELNKMEVFIGDTVTKTNFSKKLFINELEKIFPNKSNYIHEYQ